MKRFRFVAVWAGVLAGLAGVVGCGANPPAPVPPAPIPVPPGPPPTPMPGPVAGFVIVEDTASADGARVQFLGSKKVQAFLRNSGLSHAVLSTAAVGPDDTAPASVAGFLSAAKASGALPHLFLVDGRGAVVRDLPCPLDPDRFVAVFAPEHRRALGNKLGKPRLKWTTFGDAPTTAVIPRDQWREVDLEAYLPAVKDQDGVGACNAFATVTATEASREVAGLGYVSLSPGYLYGAINGGSDNGSTLEDGLAWMTKHGTCSATTVGELDWRGRPARAADEARGYRVVEAFLCPTFDHVASAVQQGFFIVEGVAWANSYQTPDADGWLPPADYTVGGHALCGYGLAKRGNQWGIKTRNSWGPGWGVGGNCVIPEAAFDGLVSGYWAVRSVVRTPEPFPPAEPGRVRRAALSPSEVLGLRP